MIQIISRNSFLTWIVNFEAVEISLVEMSVQTLKTALKHCVCKMVQKSISRSVWLKSSHKTEQEPQFSSRQQRSEKIQLISTVVVKLTQCLNGDSQHSRPFSWKTASSWEELEHELLNVPVFAQFFITTYHFGEETRPRRRLLKTIWRNKSFTKTKNEIRWPHKFHAPKDKLSEYGFIC